jgi:hypothetical protein
MDLSAAYLTHDLLSGTFMARGAAINPTEGCDRVTTGAAIGQFTSAVWNHWKHELG